MKRVAVELVLREKDAELARGFDRHGLKLAPLSRWTRLHRRSAMGPADPAAPPLQPAYGLSRTRAWMKGKADPDGVLVYWTGGWGRILSYHAAGAPNRWARTGRLPVRDVLGASQAVIARVRRGVAQWWREWQREHRRWFPPAAPSTLPAPLRPLAPLLPLVAAPLWGRPR